MTSRELKKRLEDAGFQVAHCRYMPRCKGVIRAYLFMYVDSVTGKEFDPDANTGGERICQLEWRVDRPDVVAAYKTEWVGQTVRQEDVFVRNFELPKVSA